VIEQPAVFGVQKSTARTPRSSTGVVAARTTSAGAPMTLTWRRARGADP